MKRNENLGRAHGWYVYYLGCQGTRKCRCLENGRFWNCIVVLLRDQSRRKLYLAKVSFPECWRTCLDFGDSAVNKRRVFSLSMPCWEQPWISHLRSSGWENSSVVVQQLVQIPLWAAYKRDFFSFFSDMNVNSHFAHSFVRLLVEIPVLYSCCQPLICYG